MAGALTAAIAAAFAGGVTPDPYYEYTTLLLPGNGTNGAQNNTFLDSSTNNFTITRNGNTTQGTFSPFSQTGWGNYFNGSSSLTPSSGSFLAVGANNYTIEFWVYLTANAAANHAIAINATNGLVIVLGPTKTSLNQFAVGDIVATGSGLSINTWHHVAIVRSGTGSNQTAIYIDGVRDTVGTDATNWTATGNPRIGGNIAGQYITGYLSNIRVVNSAIYSGTNITVPTSPLSPSEYAGTTFLTCQNNRFLDNGSTQATFTVNGSPTVVAFSPFNPSESWSAATYGGSGYFDGSGDYLNTNYTLNWSTYGSYTLEFWVYHTTMAPTNQWYFVGGTGGTGNTIFYNYSNGRVGLGINGTNEIVSAVGVIKANTWQHVAYTYNGTTTKIYVDGVEVASGTTAVYANSSVAIAVGGGSSSSLTVMNGYMANLRLSQSVIYTTAFTPPTSPVTGGVLLLNFTNAGIYDATSKNDLETVGNAQISTTQSKWGGSSMSFDGTGDWLKTPASTLWQFGTGDFTIEFWWYPNSLATYQQILSVTDNVGVTGAGQFAITYNTSLGLRFFINAGATTIDQGSTSGWSAGQWYYIAAVRSGNTLTLYRNGSSIASGSVTGVTIGANVPVYIGGEQYTPHSNNGYLQDVRITKGYARTVTTSPTAAFPTL